MYVCARMYDIDLDDGLDCTALLSVDAVPL